MKVFSSLYFVIKQGRKEIPVSSFNYGKLDDKEYIKSLHESLDSFLEQVKKSFDIQDVQTEFIVNLCAPNYMEEEE